MRSRRPFRSRWSRKQGESDETVTVGADVRYAHDLDTLDTQVRVNPDAFQPKAEPVEAPDGELAGMFTVRKMATQRTGTDEQKKAAYSRERAAELVAKAAGRTASDP